MHKNKIVIVKKTIDKQCVMKYINVDESLEQKGICMEKCLCGGALKYYDGSLGYESMQCQSCGFHWDSHNEAEHEENVKQYHLQNGVDK
jgi:hypothetical protein